MCIVYVLVNVLCVALASIIAQIIILFAIKECIVTYCILCCYAMAFSLGKDNLSGLISTSENGAQMMEFY